MQLFYNRPLCTVCAAYVAASLLAFYFNPTLKIALAFSIAALVIVILIFALFGNVKKITAAVLGVAAVFALTAVFRSYICFDRDYMGCEKYHGEESDITASVTERRYSGESYSVYGIRIKTIDGKDVNLNAVLECTYAADIQPGDIIGGKVRFGTLDELYGGYVKKSLLADGYKMLATDIGDDTNGLEILGKEKQSLKIFADRINTRLCAKLNSGFGKTTGGIAGALFLGNRDGISDTTARDFRRSGTSHILALSGMHTSLILGIAAYLLSRLGFFGIGRKVQTILLCFIAPAYLILTGCSVSALRSVIMVSAMYIAYLIGGKGDTVTNLFLAGTLILGFSPEAVCDVSFWLSFCATFGIVAGNEALAPLFEKLRGFVAKHPLLKFPVYILSAISISVCANIAVMFLMWMYFGELSLMAPVSTLIVSPLAYTIIILTVIYLLLSWVPVLSGVICFAVSKLSSLMLGLTAGISDLDFATVSFGDKLTGTVILSMTVLLVVLIAIKLKHRILMISPPAIATVAMIVIIICRGFASGTDMIYLHTTKSEMLVISSSHQNVICDISDGSYTHFNKAANMLKGEYRTVTDAIILTHYHKKHITSISKYSSDNIVRELLLPEPLNENEREIMNSIIKLAEARGIKIQIYSLDNSVNLNDDLKISVKREYIKRSTHPVISIKASGKDHAVCYVGASASEAAEETTDMIDSEVSKTDYLILGSHGPKIKNPYSFDISADSYNIKEILFANNDTVVYADLNGTGLGDYINLKKPVLIFEPEYRRFVLTD